MHTPRYRQNWLRGVTPDTSTRALPVAGRTRGVMSTDQKAEGTASPAHLPASDKLPAA